MGPRPSRWCRSRGSDRQPRRFGRTAFRKLAIASATVRSSGYCPASSPHRTALADTASLVLLLPAPVNGQSAETDDGRAKQEFRGRLRHGGSATKPAETRNGSREKHDESNDGFFHGCTCAPQQAFQVPDGLGLFVTNKSLVINRSTTRHGHRLYQPGRNFSGNVAKRTKKCKLAPARNERALLHPLPPRRIAFLFARYP